MFKDHRADLRNAETLQAFNVYRTASLLDVLDRPRTHAFVDGVAVRCQVSVVSADTDGLVLMVKRAQLPAIERAHTVLLESPLHGATFRTTVDAVDHERAHVSVSRLEPFKKYHERRESARTVPGMVMLARVRGGTQEANGRVVDLSSSALAVDFEHDAFLRVAMEPRVRLEVSGDDGSSSPLEPFDTEARIGRTSEREERGAQVCRAVLELDTYPALDRALRQYIARRQLHILTELLVAGGNAPSREACDTA